MREATVNGLSENNSTWSKRPRWYSTLGWRCQSGCSSVSNWAQKGRARRGRQIKRRVKDVPAGTQRGDQDRTTPILVL